MRAENPFQMNYRQQSNYREEWNIPEETIILRDQNISADFIEALDNAIRRLPDKMKSAIILREIEGYSYKEIGDILNCTPDIVKSVLYNTRRHLIENLCIGSYR